MKVYNILFIFLAVVVSVSAGAQMDPTSVLLFKGDGRSSSQDAYKSDRYTTRPSKKINQSGQVQTRDNKKNGNKRNSKSSPRGKKNGLGKGNNQISEPSPALPQSDQREGRSRSGFEDQRGRGHSNFSDNMRDFILGGSQESVGEYKRQLNPKDIRRNFIEVGVAPLYMYIDSSSQFWLRSYWSQGPGFLGEATLWLSPFLGLKGGFSTSLGTTIRGNTLGTENILADHQNLNVGVRFRRFFGYSRRSAYLTFGLDYFEYKMILPPDATYRVNVETAGAQFSLGFILPTSRTHSWDVGVTFMPRANQTENSQGVATRSGHHPEAYSFGLWFGGQFNWNRTQRYFWKISHRVDRSFYEGQANQVDPITGETYKGVGVTQGISQFQMGFRWGN